jgi:predicted DNA-binding protein
MVPLWYHGAMAMNLRLSDEEQALLDAMAEQSGLSKAEVLRRAIVEKAIRDGNRSQVEESLTWALTRYDDLLRRLGTA